MNYYLLFAAILFIIVVLVVYVRQKKIIKKVKSLSYSYKTSFLNDLIEPFGYIYNLSRDIFSTRVDSWQKTYGYGTIYDKMAPFANMIFDCQPIYFDYDNKTWLIEFWKGQYGINVGSEVGIYCSDHVIPSFMRDKTIFSAVDEDNYLRVCTELFYRGNSVASLCQYHWWLTIFCMGQFAHPKDLSMNVSIRFPNYEMMEAFLSSVEESKTLLHVIHVDVYQNTVTLSFYRSMETFSFIKRFYRYYVLQKNHFFCSLYHFATRPFNQTCDKLLYLYYSAPFLFRKMLRLKQIRK